jgi:hypothetical protein
MNRFRRVARLGTAAILTVTAASARPPVAAQVSTETPNVSPVYEGWEANRDGTFNLVFGYFNRSWESAPLVPIGAENSFTPGAADQGQPTYFLPRRNHFVFRIKVPADFGTKELVWTLTTLGRTEKAYGTLKPDYVIDDMIMMSNIGAGGALSSTPDMVGNIAPTVKLEGARARTASVGSPIDLAAVVTDDDKPRPRQMPAVLGGDYTLPNSAKGLRFSWFVYRGDGGGVTFDPPQSKVWEDNRDGGNSPWSAGWKNPPLPPENRWSAKATFTKPGVYTIRAIAHDGGLATTEDIVVTVR